MTQTAALKYMVETYNAEPLDDMNEGVRQLIEDCLFLQFEEDFGHEANQRLLDRRDACDILAKLYA